MDGTPSEALRRALDDHGLPLLFQGDEAGVPAGDAHRQGFIGLRIPLRFPQGLRVDGVELHKAAVQLDEPAQQGL